MVHMYPGLAERTFTDQSTCDKPYDSPDDLVHNTTITKCAPFRTKKRGSEVCLSGMCSYILEFFRLKP